MADDSFPAIWCGPFDAELPGGQRVARGEQANVSAGDLLSAHWQAVKPSRPVPVAVSAEDES